MRSTPFPRDLYSFSSKTNTFTRIYSLLKTNRTHLKYHVFGCLFFLLLLRRWNSDGLLLFSRMFQ